MPPINVPPVATNVFVSGITEVGKTLFGNYEYSDANNDPEGTSIFKWYADGAAIPSADGKSIVLTSSELGKTIQFEVTPVALTGIRNGTPVNSTSSSVIVNPNNAPTVTDVKITGTPQVGQTLTGGYTYNDVNADPEGVSTFKWYADDVVIPGATAIAYTLTPGELNKKIRFEVTPVALTGTLTGQAVKSAETLAVTP
ncbi:MULTISPECIES: hypothetical protein [unclassified Brevibacillus]|uniref:hypothetical protein n=1 Tax=unclassified Brevibacillus TaxID=2684853 RepID=UPI00156B75EC|nr:hypothetical protein [Brevibacillus sp. HD3.3A]UED68707.1 hypothetical protein HP435_26295 [Brevibacillus sp. HD3.3A]